MLKGTGVKFVIVETLFFFLVFIAIGFYFKPSDPLFLKSPINPFLLFITVFTLYYGFLAGLLLAVFSAVVFYEFTSPFPTSFYLWNLLFILIASEFHYYWKHNLEILKEEGRYFKEKLRTQTSEFILFKLSYDQLESQYLLKPMTIRNVLKTISEKAAKEGEDVIPDFLNLVSQAFGVESASLYLKKQGKFKRVGDIGEGVQLVNQDPMVRETIENLRASFISSLDEKVSYLAVIPIMVSDELVGLFLIDNMPFVNLSSDNMLSITVACNWLLREIQTGKIIEGLADRLPEISGKFLRELNICKDLYVRFGIESTMVVFSIPNEKQDLLFNFFDERVRGIDAVCKVNTSSKLMVLALLPMSYLSVAKGFAERVENEMIKIFGAEFLDGIEHIVFKVNGKIEANIRELLNVR